MIRRNLLGQAIVFVAVLVFGACAPGARAVPAVPAPIAIELEPEELGEGPEIDDVEVKVVELGLLGDVAYDLPLEANTWVEAELRFLVEDRTAVIGRWIQRGDFYEPFIKSVLAEHGLPTDLFHLAMIESGFVPTARSRAGAVGLWQFMPATARLEGLRVDGEVDERLDPVRSTYAAARHLSRLHRSFRGDWALAAAAYNAGIGRISRGLAGFEVDNFWDLAVLGNLAEETKHYVPRLYAMTIVTRDRPRFGFEQAPLDAPTFAVDTVAVDIPTPLAELAALGDVSVDELTRLNPHLLHRSTPDGNYHVWVPTGAGAGLQHAFLNSEFRRTGGYGVYVVRRGDTLGRIAQQSGVPAARIRQLNPRVNWDRLPIGHRVRLPARGATAMAARAGSPPPSSTAAELARGSTGTSSGSASPARAAASSSTRHVVHTGETLWGIARHYGVTVTQIQTANGMNGTRIVVGRTLIIPTAGSGNGSATTARRSEPATEHVVKAGETLWGIARGYSSTVAAIRELNRMDGEVIRPGQKLLIPRPASGGE